jgi:hypothetical protein
MGMLDYLGTIDGPQDEPSGRVVQELGFARQPPMNSHVSRENIP